MNQPTRTTRAISLTVALTIVLVASFGIWSRSSCAPPNNTGTLRRITVAQTGDFFLYAPLYIAVDGGFFRHEGLDVSIVNTGGDDKTWAAVLSGSAEFGVADPTFVAVSAVRGQNGVVVASLVNGVPFWGITYRDIAPIKDAKQLARLSVATFPSPSTAYALQKRMFTDAGLTPNIREGNFGAIIALLKAGDADIGLELEPNVSQAASEGAKVVYSMAERYGDFAMTGVTTTALTVRRDGALVRSVISALQGALNMLHSNPDEALALLLKRFPGVSIGVGKAALERVLHDEVIPRSTTISESAWKKAVLLRIEVGDLKEVAPYTEFVWDGKSSEK
jgi:NitT/TauT family transport system substrate-binding protein